MATTLCQVCGVDPFKYKCPTCYIKHCSLDCYKVHRQSPCEKPSGVPPSDDNSAAPFKYQFPTADTVPLDKLQELAGSEEVKECLSNPHVRQMLKSLVQSQTPDSSIKEAMQEPIFLELAHACLKIVEPQNGATE
uniref:EOG090X0JQ4 n=1 Tax=Alona affinis TaxID=381656 RepID=A0A9N6WX44_9CRUS|nr:EOG090X0JQ4 [Alona affinis]